MSGRRYGAGVWAFGNLGDRFLLQGYRPDAPVSLEDLVRSAAGIAHLHGIEFNVPTHVTLEGADRLQGLLGHAGLACIALGVEVTADAKWRFGSLSSPVAKVWNEAIAIHKEAMDAAAALGAPVVNSWLGQDGHDVAFQQDYLEHGSRLVEAYREIAGHRADIRLAIEYKSREPQVHSLAVLRGLERILDRLGGEALVRGLRQEHALDVHRRNAQALAPAGEPPAAS